MVSESEKLISSLLAERDVARHELAERNRLLEEIRKKFEEPGDTNAKVGWLLDRLQFSCAAR